MNKENVLAVAAAIEGHTIPDLGFNMRLYRDTTEPEWPGGKPFEDRSGHNCGTVACIAGWTNAVLAEDPAEGRFSRAAELLGLAEKQADALFYPPFVDGENLWDASTQQAAAVLRHLAKTGKVDWSIK